jgi:hypothetical protein
MTSSDETPTTGGAAETPAEPSETAEPAGTAEPLETAAPSTPRPATSSPVPAALVKPTGRYRLRFGLLYGALGLILVAAVVGVVAVLAGSGSGTSPSAWSSWRPAKGSTAKMASEIADHVASQYHLNKKGAQLVAVVAGPPQVTSGTHKVTISNIAVAKTPSTTKGIQIVPSGNTWTDQLCGLGSSCSIASGQPSVTRGRLVRREALEVALYTFKFVPAIHSIVAFMPPPPGTTQSTLLYLQRENFAKQLSEPLSQTLPLEKPPLPTSPDRQEAPTIDKLTLPAIYKYSLQQLQDASALLVLNPFQT